MRTTIQQVIGSGLVSDESRFSRMGCDYHKPRLTGTVYDCQGYKKLHDDELEEFQICAECLNELYYGSS